MKKTIFLSGILFLATITITFGQREFEQGDQVSPLERIYFGGGMSLQFGSDVTVIGASPTIGYMITNRFSAGFGVTYLHRKFFGVTSNLLGGNVFARYNITQQFFLFSQYEVTSFDPNPLDANDAKESVPAFFAGGGMYQPFSDRAGFMIIALYDLAHDNFRSLSREPFSIRAGITFSPF